MKVSDHIHCIKHTFSIPVKPGVSVDRFVYSYIIFGKEGIYLVDSGVKDSIDKIFDYIASNGRLIDEVKQLILTHSHPDHIGSAQEIQRKTSCRISAHANERNWIENVDQQYNDRPVPGFDTLVGGSVEVDHGLNDGDVVVLEDHIRINVIHSPGHSAGSISLLFKDEGVLISGDTLLLPGSLPIYDNFVDTVASIENLRKIAGIKVLLSSWDEPCYGGKIYQVMENSIKYLNDIHNAISQIPDAKKLEPLELCRVVVEQLGLPPFTVNPLVARSFQATL